MHKDCALAQRKKFRLKLIQEWRRQSRVPQALRRIHLILYICTLIKKFLCTWRLKYSKLQVIFNIYRVIKTFLCTWRINYSKLQVMFNIYRVIKKFLCTWRLQYSKLQVIFNIYRVIKKFLCTWRLKYSKLQVMFKVSPASLQTFIDTRLTLMPSVTPNSNYVIMLSEWNSLKYFYAFCTVIIRCTEIFRLPCMKSLRA
jgi:hypothetical protein